MEVTSFVGGVLAGLGVPPLVDAFLRWRRLSAYLPTAGGRTARPARLLVLIPARAEGPRVAELALDFRREARTSGVTADVIVVLDGGDAPAEQRLRAEAVEYFVKEPAGPSKAFALLFAAERLGARLEAADVIMVFDADMRLPPGFLSDLALPAGTEAFQLPVRPAGTPLPGAARVEALSLAVATRVEDAARDAVSLPVRLRGKAMGFSPRAFRLGPLGATKTMAEDSEATLLLLGAGVRIRALTGPVAFDEPAAAEKMAAPRARWLAGHAKLLVTGAGDLGRILLKNPLAAFTLAADLWLRPRAFVLFALVVAAIGSDAALVFVSSKVGTAVAGASGVPLAAPGTGRLLFLLLFLSLEVKFGLVFEALYLIAARRLLGYPPEVPGISFGDVSSFVRLWMRAAGRAIMAPGTWHRARPLS